MKLILSRYQRNVRKKVTKYSAARGNQSAECGGRYWIFAVGAKTHSCVSEYAQHSPCESGFVFSRFVCISRMRHQVLFCCFNISGMADAIIHGYSFLSANLVSDTQKTGRKRRSYIMWRQLCCYLLAERERGVEEDLCRRSSLRRELTHVRWPTWRKLRTDRAFCPRRKEQNAWNWHGNGLGKRPLVAKHREIANLYARRARYLCEIPILWFCITNNFMCEEKFPNISSLWQPWNWANNASGNSIFFAEMESRLWQNTFGTVSKLFHGCQNKIFEQNAKFVSVFVDSKMNCILLPEQRNQSIELVCIDRWNFKNWICN